MGIKLLAQGHNSKAQVGIELRTLGLGAQDHNHYTKLPPFTLITYF